VGLTGTASFTSKKGVKCHHYNALDALVLRTSHSLSQVPQLRTKIIINAISPANTTIHESDRQTSYVAFISDNGEEYYMTLTESLSVWIMRITYKDRITNETMSNRIRQMRPEWLGHVLRMKDDRLTKTVHRWKSIGKRSAGWPNKRWMDCTEEALWRAGVTKCGKTAGREWMTLNDIAADRKQWRNQTTAPARMVTTVFKGLILQIVYIHTTNT